MYEFTYQLSLQNACVDSERVQHIFHTQTHANKKQVLLMSHSVIFDCLPFQINSLVLNVPANFNVKLPAILAKNL